MIEATMEGYFFICDLLGFSNIVENSSEDELSKRIQAWVSLVETAASDCHVTRHQLISDTVFAAADSRAEELRRLADFGRHLLSIGIGQSLPIRGAITYGRYEWGKLTYGKAVIRAHELEMSQNWIGVACDNLLPHIDDVWGLDSIICYPAPMKGTHIRTYPVIAWEVPEFRLLANYLTHGGLSKEGEELTWDWADKVNNTLTFRMYRRWLAGVGKSSELFHGSLPLQVLSDNA
jgi:hypothetical protein